MQRIGRFVVTLAALIFLGVSWAWERFHPLIQAIIDRIPLEALKRAIARFIAALPPYATLLLFLIPLIASEAIKLISYWLFAKRQFALGLVVYLIAEVLRFGLVAFVFRTCRDKLLSIGWFARLYLWTLGIHDWAKAKAAPVLQEVRAALHAAGFGGRRGSLTRKMSALWRYARDRTRQPKSLY